MVGGRRECTQANKAQLDGQQFASGNGGRGGRRRELSATDIIIELGGRPKTGQRGTGHSKKKAAGQLTNS